MSRLLLALAMLPLSLAGIGYLQSAPPPAQRGSEAPVLAATAHVPSNVLIEGRWLDQRPEARQSPGRAFLARWGDPYRGEEPLEPATRSAAVPAAMGTDEFKSVADEFKSVRSIRMIRIAERAERADDRVGLCERHGMSKVWVSKYRWRCRK
jgi:hypothetical protein